MHRYFNKEDGVLGLYPTLKYIRTKNGSLSIRSNNVLVKLDLSKKQYQERFDELYNRPSLDWLTSILKVTNKPTIPGVHILVELSLV